MVVHAWAFATIVDTDYETSTEKSFRYFRIHLNTKGQRCDIEVLEQAVSKQRVVVGIDCS